MTNYCYRSLLILLLPTFVLSKNNDFGANTISINESSNLVASDKDISSFVLTSLDSANNAFIEGNITSIFHEQVDSVWIKYKIEKLTEDSIFSIDGLFRIPVGDMKKDRLIELEFKHPEFHIIDTSIVISSSFTPKLNIQLIPKYKISLRGRVFAGNIPIQGVKVQINLMDKTYQLETRGCYYDSEKYWNCLYDGMFKQDLILDNSTDSIKLVFEKSGMKPLAFGMVLSDYSGDIINVKMKYASKLSVQPNNCLNLKLTFPFLSIENNWFVDLAYYRMLKGKFLNRFSIGLDANLLLTPISVSHHTFGENTATFDTSYFTGTVGPSVLFWIVKPENRYFSTYAGLTAGIGLENGDFSVQPFLGTRVFIDFNKAISLELRQISYDIDVVHYTFNPYGNAFKSSVTEEFMDYLLSVGIQIIF
jgi:hypothetical protein